MMKPDLEKEYNKYKKKYSQNKLSRLAQEETIQNYDLIIIGGGSAGLACANEAIKHNKKIAIFNYVEPTISGTTWGLGGTCLNVGCVPKKLFRHAGYIGDILKIEAAQYGWSVDTLKNDWSILKNNVQDYIKSQNYKNNTTLNNNDIDYFNKLATFIDANTLETMGDDGNLEKFRAKTFIIATGCRPVYPNIEGAEYGITSDDLFSLEHSPGDTLVIGGSYIALECATMLKALMCNVTVITRSVFLRQFDKEMVHILMKKLDLNVIKNTDILKIELLNNNKKRVFYTNKDNENAQIDVDTVIFAIGRKANINNMNLTEIGVEMNNKIIVNKENQTNVPNIYAIGDVSNNFELNTIAVQSAKLLVQRLYTGVNKHINYNIIPTTIFTLPVEYAFVGLSEAEASDKYDIEVYHQYTDPIEWYMLGLSNTCYIKIICNKIDGKVLGIHIVGPLASEIIQGYCLSLNNGLTIYDINNIIGIHPTISEAVVGLHITKSSGISPKNESC